MKKLIAIFALLALAYSFNLAGFLETGAAAAEQKDVSQPVTSVVNGNAGKMQEPTSGSSPEETTTPEPAETLPSETEEVPAAPQEPAEAPGSLNETVYATTDVNVRTGPGTKHSKIGILSRGSSILRTEKGSDGWSKVVFEGSEGYIRSKYLSGKKANASANGQSHQIQAFDDTSVFFDTVDDTVYATTEVNVRTGPGTQYAVLGHCEFQERIQRTGIGENGWSRVVYNDETAYIRSKYLSDSKPKSRVPGGAGNTYGRLTIPAIGINVALYYCASNSESYGPLAQSIVDAADSAVYLDQVNVGGAIIADHKHQGFSAIEYCVAGKTRAYIDYGAYTQEYLCTDVGRGSNTGGDLIDWNGNSLNYGSIPGGLAMYTCKENWNNIILTFWKPV